MKKGNTGTIKSRKMNAVKRIFIVLSGCVLLAGCGNNDKLNVGDQMIASDAEAVQETTQTANDDKLPGQVLFTENLHIITDFSKITDAEWDYVVDPELISGFSNRELFANRYEHNIGLRHGFLQIPQEELKIHLYTSDFYTITVNKNAWFFIKEIPRIDTTITSLEGYVVDSNLNFHYVTISEYSESDFEYKSDGDYNITEAANGWQIYMSQEKGCADTMLVNKYSDSHYLVADIGVEDLTGVSDISYPEAFAENIVVEKQSGESTFVELPDKYDNISVSDDMYIDAENFDIISWKIDDTSNNNQVTLRGDDAEFHYLISEVPEGFTLDEAKLAVFGPDAKFESKEYSGKKLELAYMDLGGSNCFVGFVMEVGGKYYSLDTGFLDPEGIEDNLNFIFENIFKSK